MFKLELKSIRPKEDLVLSGETNIQVPGKIVQYLLTYQISGIRFLFNLYKKVRLKLSAIFGHVKNLLFIFFFHHSKSLLF